MYNHCHALESSAIGLRVLCGEAGDGGYTLLPASICEGMGIVSTKTCFEDQFYTLTLFVLHQSLHLLALVFCCTANPQI